MKKILLLEPETYVRDFAADALRRGGFTVLKATDAEKIPEILQKNPQLRCAVLDVSVEDVFGLCEQIRLQQPKTAILVLAGKQEQTDAITGLMTGADEMLQKPFSSHQLVSTVDRLLTSTREELVEEGQLLSSGPFILNIKDFTLDKLEQRIPLTRAEFSMVKFFLENPGKALSRQELHDYVWGRDDNADLKIVEQQVRHLRLKLEDEPGKPAFITTVWGYGYQWNS